MGATQKQGFFLYNFLTEPRYRMYRHALLILSMLVIALNQAHMLYEGFSLKSVGGFWVPVVAVAAAYLAAVYFNLYVLIPKFLFARKYLNYVEGVLLSAALLVVVLDLIEYTTHWVMELPVGENSILNPQYSLVADLFFTFPLLVVSVGGGAATSLLREWSVENRTLLQLKKNYLQSELEQLKQRIAPDFLFKMLDKAGELSVTHPEKSSSILVGLSRVLRYQLYDCSRDKVLLHSEISFIRSYLDLYGMYNGAFSYHVIVSGTQERVFIPPLLFIPLIQLMLRKSPDEATLHIDFLLSGDAVGFRCTVVAEAFEQWEDSDLSEVRRRLGFLYGGSYQLADSEKRIVLQLNHAGL